HNADLSQNADFLIKARMEAEKAKVALSRQQSFDIIHPFFGLLPGGGTVDLDLELTRAAFEEDIRPMIASSMERVDRALRSQHLKPDDITEVLMVGGSTAIPLVLESVTNLFGPGKVRRSVNPMECVALGAAILAASQDLTDAPGIDAKSDGVADAALV